jgi:nitrogen fixation protein NifX
MRIAITTNDLVNLDAPFGLAHYIVVYQVDRDGFRLSQVHRFPARDPSCSLEALRWRAAALKNCGLLCTLEIGEAGRMQVRSEDVRTLRVARPRPIADVLATLLRQMEDHATPWLQEGPPDPTVARGEAHRCAARARFGDD